MFLLSCVLQLSLVLYFEVETEGLPDHWALEHATKRHDGGELILKGKFNILAIWPIAIIPIVIVVGLLPLVVGAKCFEIGAAEPQADQSYHNGI